MRCTLPKSAFVAGRCMQTSEVSCAYLLRFSIGQTTTSWCSQGCQGIVDTGTFQLTVPEQYIGELLQAVGVPENSDYVGATGAYRACKGMGNKFCSASYKESNTKQDDNVGLWCDQIMIPR